MTNPTPKRRKYDRWLPRLQAWWRQEVTGSTRLLVLAFGAILLLMLILGVVDLYALHANNQRMEKVVQEHNVKIALVLALRGINRERALTVHKMILARDPFERDSLMLYFRELASSYVKQRDQLRSLPFTADEDTSFKAAQSKIRESTRLMEQVVGLIEQERLDEAEFLLATEAIPAQAQAQEDFANFLELQYSSSKEAVSSARAAYQYTFWLGVLLGGAALLLGLWVAINVVRRTMRVERDLAREKERAEVTLYSIGDAVITTDAHGNVVHMNEMAERLTGWSSNEAVGQAMGDIYRVSDEQQPAHQLDLTTLLQVGRTVSLPESALLTARNDMQYAIEQNVSPIRETDGEVIGMVVVFRDVTAERSLVHELAWRASHDALTSLANRHTFERRLRELVDSAVSGRITHALLYIDLDQFKLVNDTCGHTAGDQLLRQLSNLLASKVRAVDTLARLGGDEFGLLLPGCNIEQAQIIAEKLRQEIGEFRFQWQGKTFVVGASIGLVEVAQHSGAISNLLTAADTACYMAKQRGRNRVCVHRPQDSEMRRMHGEAEWAARINRAFEENRFQLYFQRIVPVQPQQIECREILLRMRDETGQLVPPMAFLPAAERYGLMPSIDRWVMRTLFTWLQKQDGAADGVNYAINLSGHTLGDEKLADFIQDLLRDTGVSPQRICFEVTETAAIANLGQAVRLMTRLQDFGCSFALDDFGSGMSSFTYLKNLPVDSLKIDGAFVRDMLTDPIDQAMVEAIIRIGHVMELQTIAEFVETPEILQRLQDCEVDYVQGFAVHRPEPLF